MVRDTNALNRKVSFYLRKKIQEKVVIIESDDWGLERAKNESSVQKIINKYSEKKCTRWTKDAIESVEDLNMLFDLCGSFSGKFLNMPIITANFITHNIDYSSKDELRFKPISEGYNFGENALFDKYREGLLKKYFFPQLHGFSHYNTNLLIKDFKSEDFTEDFELGFPLAKSTIRENLSLYRAECFDPDFAVNFESAVSVFFKVFGYYSKSFIPPNYMYSSKLNGIVSDNHIQLLQSSGHFRSPENKSFIFPYYRKYRKLFYSSRNARLDVHNDYNFLADNCIKQIEQAFFNKMPAVIDIHRVNFSGSYSPDLRRKTIDELDKVFTYLVKKHPEVVFMSTDALADKLNKK